MDPFKKWVRLSENGYHLWHMEAKSENIQNISIHNTFKKDVNQAKLGFIRKELNKIASANVHFSTKSYKHTFDFVT